MASHVDPITTTMHGSLACIMNKAHNALHLDSKTEAVHHSKLAAA
jgi:hypothetical protein